MRASGGTVKVREEPSSVLKPKTRKQGGSKKEVQAEDSRCGHEAQVCLLLSVVLTSLFPQRPGAAVRHAAGEQAEEELHVQTSAAPRQRPEDAAAAETET